MIIVRFFGGLGNQLFQYALYKKYESLGREVYADLSYIEGAEKYYSCDSRKNMLLNTRAGMRNVGIHLNVIQDKRVIQSLSGDRRSLAGLVSRYITRKATIITESAINTLGGYTSSLLEVESGYVDGYWQTEKYFEDIKDVICNSIDFVLLDDDNNTNILKLVHSTPSVSVHIRRGDYLSPMNRECYGDICTEKYYLNAIRYFEKMDNSSTFFFFSDDIEWAKNTFSPEVKNAFFIDWNSGENSYYDMYLMSQCKNNIIANSSFSWWGAWLNESKGKVVVSPSKWANNGYMPDTICSSWIRM